MFSGWYVPLSISSERIDEATIQQSDVQAVAERCVAGVTATGNQVLVQATGPNPPPDLAVLRSDLGTEGLDGWTCGSA